METLLALPLVFLVLALLVNMGYGWLQRIKADRAARFGATYYVMARSEGMDAAVARAATRRILNQRYSLDTPPFDLRSMEGGRDIEPASGGRQFTGILLNWLSGFSSRQRIEVSVPRQPPVGALLPSTPVESYLEIDGNTWTHQELPLTLDALTDTISELGSGGREGDGIGGKLGGVLKWAGKILGGFVGTIFDGFFWLLGMKA